MRAARLCQQVRGQQEVLVRSWRCDHAGLEEIAHTTDAQQIADKRIPFTVPGKQYRTAGQLPLGLGDAVQLPGCQVELRLQDATRPGQGDEIESTGARQSNHHRLQSLTGRGMTSPVVGQDPAVAAAQGQAGADARGIGTHGFSLLVEAGQDQAEEREPTVPGGQEAKCIARSQHGYTRPASDVAQQRDSEVRICGKENRPC